MAGKISELTATATLAGAQAEVLQGGGNYRYSFNRLRNLATNFALSLANEAKALAAYRRVLDIVALGFKASGDADATSTGGAVDTSAGAWKPASADTRILGGTPTTPNFGGTAANINDNSTGTSITTSGLGALNAVGVGGRIIGKIDYGANKTITKIEAIGLSESASSTPCTAVYSTDNTNWTQLGADFTVTTSPQTFSRTGSVTARYVAIAAEATSYGAITMTLQDLNGYEAVTTNAVLITPYQTADAAVTKGRVVLEVDPVVALTLGTDLTIEVTCNGGTNWSAASTYTNCGKGDGGRTVIETDEVTCTGGTSFAARIKNLNNKMFHTHKAIVEVAA